MRLRSIVGAGRWVLVVDDEETIRNVSGQLLRKRGFEPMVAAEGQAAMRMLQADPTRFAADH